MKPSRYFFLLTLVTLLISGVFGVSMAQDKPYDGVVLDVLTFTGPQIAEPLIRRAPDFNELTGAQVNVVQVPNADLYQAILTDQATGTNIYDAFVFAPQWMVDYIGPGYLEDLTPYVENDPDIQWDDATRALTKEERKAQKKEYSTYTRRRSINFTNVHKERGSGGGRGEGGGAGGAAIDAACRRAACERAQHTAIHPRSLARSVRPPRLPAVVRGLLGVRIPADVHLGALPRLSHRSRRK